ncbi:MAG: hypothetical protein QXV81_04650 [Ignisphaera sp.]
MRGFRDRDFIESREGLLFAVIGNTHPVDRIIAYLKYIPGYQSNIRVKWSRNGLQFGRILPYYSAIGVAQTMDFLRRNYPHYIVFDKYRSIELIEVPRSHINRHYRPEERLRELLSGSRDLLEEQVVELVTRISEESGVSLNNFGITGSILLKIHNLTYSDIDLIVYGIENSYRVRETIKNLLNTPNSGFYRPVGEALEEWARDIVKIHPLSIEEARLLYSKYKWNRAFYKGRQFSIHPVKTEDEVSEKWEDKIVKPLGLVKIRARIADSRNSIFMPAIYSIENAKVIEGVVPPKPIRYVISYEGLYMDLARDGDEIIAYGKLEMVEDVRQSEEYLQVAIGTFEARGKDYIKPVAWLEALQ